MDLALAILTEHAASQIGNRKLAEFNAGSVLDSPEAVSLVREGSIVAQAMVGEHLMRVFVDVDRTPPEIVTAYRTSQIEKYRSQA